VEDEYPLPLDVGDVLKGPMKADILRSMSKVRWKTVLWRNGEKFLIPMGSGSLRELTQKEVARSTTPIIH